MGPLLLLLSLFVSIVVVIKIDEAVLFPQSELCREEELKNNFQCFKEIPEENYEVLVGENVMIKCVVANQKGKAQWRVGDRMLGFNRKIPFKPRFSMVGDEDAGDQSLRIENVSISDAGEYECQITRGNYGKKELRKATRLTVLVPPETPLIFENKNKQSISTVLITISSKPYENQNTKLNLKCVSKGGQPNPTFEWYHNNQQLKDQELSVQIIDALIQSHLSMSVTQLMSGDFIACVVFNKATLRNSQTEQQKLKTTVTVVINTLPGTPKIIDVSNKLVVSEKMSISVSCRSQPAGEPPGNIKWEWSSLNSKSLDNLQFNIAKDWINNFIDSGSLLSRVTIPIVDRNFHGLYLICRLNHDLVEDQTDKIQIWVEHGPSNLTIDSSIGKPKRIQNSYPKTIWNDAPLIYARQKQKLMLQCSTSKYYGDVNLAWYIHFDASQNKNVWKLMDSANSKENAVDGGLGRIQVSYFDFVHSAEESVVLKCEAEFKNTVKISNLIIIETIKIPSSPIIKLNNDFITENSEVIIYCSTMGGNPTPFLKLYKGNQEVLTANQTKEDSKIELNYKFTARKSMNLDKYSCGIISGFRLFEDIKSNEVLIRVLYPPTKLVLSFPPQMSIRAGKFSIFSCSTDESNPSPEINWIKYDCQDTFLSQKINVKSLSKCQAKSIESSYTVTVGKWNGSYVINSTAKILLSEKDNNNILQCSVSAVSNLNTIIKKHMKLNVLYPPIFAEIQYYYVVTEGQSINIILHPNSNPPVQSYQWLSEGSAIPHSRAVRIHENTLSIIRSEVDMMRNYTLIARNEVGTGSFTFRLNVTFGARVIGPDIEDISVNLDDKEIKLICKAQSNPTGVKAKVIWTMLDKAYNWRLLNKERQDIVDTSGLIRCNGDQWSSLGKYRAQCISSSNIAIVSTLQISNLVPSDMGRYQCLVNNTIESAATKILNLHIPVGARIIHSRRRQFSGGEIGHSAKLFCWVFGYPKPKVIWYRETSNLTLISGKKFMYEMEILRGGLYNSILTVNFIQISDYTNYFCQASNDIGTVSNRIELMPARKPDIPYGIRIVNFTNHIIFIEWMQGFNGGYPQEFMITWKPFNEYNSNVKKVDIPENHLEEKALYPLKGLTSSTQYEIRIGSKNRKFPKCQFASPILAKTAASMGSESENEILITSPSTLRKERVKSDNIVITITSISVFVFIILVINILFVSFYLRKRRNKQNLNLNQNKMDNSLGYMQCSNMEMYPAINTNTRGSSVNEISTNNSQRSLDSLKNNLKTNIDQFLGSMAATNQSLRGQGSMINYAPNLSTSICYPINAVQKDRMLTYHSSIDGNLPNLTSHSHIHQNILPIQPLSISHSLTPYSSLLRRQHIVSSQAQQEISNSSIGTPAQLSHVRPFHDLNQTCVADGLLTPINHFNDHDLNASFKHCSEYCNITNYPFCENFAEENLLINDNEKYSNNLTYPVSFRGTKSHQRCSKINSTILSSNDLVLNSHPPICQETQFSNIVQQNDSTSNSSTSSNLKRYGELSFMYNKSINTDSILFEDQLNQSFDGDLLDTAV